MPIVDISEVLLDLGLSAEATDEERAIANAAIYRAEGAVRRYLKYSPVLGERTEFYSASSRNPQRGPGVWEVEGDQAILRRLSEAATSELQVRYIPIRSVAHLYVDYDGRGGSRVGAFGAATEKTEGTDFWPNFDGEDDDGNAICRDGLIRSAGSWSTSPGTVKIVYTAGYSAEEFRGQKDMVDATPIWSAIVEEAVRRMKKVMVTKKTTGVGWVAGALTGERLGDYSYTVNPAEMQHLLGSVTDLLPSTKEKLCDFVNVGWCLTGG